MYTPQEQRKELWTYIGCAFIGGCVFVGGFGWLIELIVGR